VEGYFILNLKHIKMKAIFYFLIPLLIFAFFATGLSNEAHAKHSILIQSSDKDISSVSLSQSAEIITKRLKDFSTGEFKTSVIPEKNQIEVILTDDWDLKMAESLLIHKGSIEFYETYNHNGLVELLNGDNRLFSLLTKSEIDNSGTKIGCICGSEAAKVTDYLSTLKLSQKCKFAWTQDFDNANVCLYALKISSEKGAIITGIDIESSKYEKDRIQIKLKSNAAGLWSEATKRNLNNVIAIVLDDNVIAAPRVMSEINSGEIEISGSFTQTQGRYIATLLNNGALPVSFFVVK
jgi:preprotein translocase subunit SecD